jgi:hypothetical protein
MRPTSSTTGVPGESRGQPALRSALRIAIRGALGLALGVVVTIACGSAAPAGPGGGGGGHRVLFIGNSLTYVNDLPGTLAALADAGGDTIRVASVAKPDFALIDHLNGGSNALATIARGGWEYVVLQQGPSSLPANRDSLVLCTRLFDERIRAAGGRTALFMVWPSSDRLAYFDDVRTSYELAARTVDGLLLPAGEAWRTAWTADASLPLYGPDGYHPSPMGTYLAALVMYERITGRDARALPPRATVDGRPLAASEATVRLLQRAAHETNARFLAGNAGAR